MAVAVAVRHVSKAATASSSRTVPLSRSPNTFSAFPRLFWVSPQSSGDLDELEFFHIKLERHDVIYAEGAPTETLLEVDESAANFAEYLRQYGSVTTKETPCAPLLRYEYRRGEIKSCFRSAISPWIDRRQPVEIIRDKLDERGVTLLRQSELVL